jgi:hypothetical protein
LNPLWPTAVNGQRYIKASSPSKGKNVICHKQKKFIKPALHEDDEKDFDFAIAHKALLIVYRIMKVQNVAALKCRLWPRHFGIEKALANIDLLTYPSICEDRR